MSTSIDRHRVQRLLDEQRAQLVEVLPAAEHDDEHPPEAISIPLKQLDRQTTSLGLLTRPDAEAALGNAVNTT